jgi:hypothetical protein
MSAQLLGYVGTDVVVCCVLTSCLFALCSALRNSRVDNGRLPWLEDVMVLFACAAGVLTVAKIVALVCVQGRDSAQDATQGAPHCATQGAPHCATRAPAHGTGGAGVRGKPLL